MDERLIEAFGKKFLDIVERWPQLNADDIREVYEHISDSKYEQIYAVYDGWEDIAIEHLKRGDCDEYIRPFVDINALAKHIEITESDYWVELRSGKLLCVK